MRVVDLEEMRQIEANAAEIGFSETLIVENVGIKGARFIEERFEESWPFDEIVVMVGRGNNGADGLAIARHLSIHGYKVRAFVLFPDEEPTAENKKQLDMCRHYGVKVNEVRGTEQVASYFGGLLDRFLVIDAILGTGFRVPLSNYLFEIVNLVNTYSTYTVSIDMPSGIEGGTGAVSSAAIEADCTLAIGLPKLGHFVSEGAHHSGEMVALEVGFPPSLLAGGDTTLLTPESVASSFGARSKFAHKNTFGHCLVVGGSQGLTGALIMSASAAVRTGVGLVTAATWESNYAELTSRVGPEIMTGTIPVTHETVSDIIKNFDRYDALVLGPGLGRLGGARDTVLKALNSFHGPMVLDADALNVLSMKDDAHLLAKRKQPMVLTPHFGEFSRFAGVSVEALQDDPINYLKKAVDETNAAILLKGPCTYLGLPSGEVHINYWPNEGMASGGSGDVLSGIIGGFLAQYASIEKRDPGSMENSGRLYEALCLAVMVHSLSGRHALESLGARAMTAWSLVEHLSDAFAELETLAQR